MQPFPSERLVVVWIVCLAGAAVGRADPLVFACREENDLHRIVTVRGFDVKRVDTPREAVDGAAPGTGVLILADGYPAATTSVDEAIFAIASAKRLRLYVEYPSFLPGIAVGHPRGTRWERGVVASDLFGPDLDPLAILAIHDCSFVPVVADDPHLVVGRVAGFDRAVYGIPAGASPLLFDLPRGPGEGRVIVATTKLSHVVTGRYAPHASWLAVWRRILGLLADGQTQGRLDWTPDVRASYSRAEPLPVDAEREALRRGIEWYFTSRMVVHPSMLARYDAPANGPEPGRADPDPGVPWPFGHRIAALPPDDSPAGDGSLGVLEGFDAKVFADGSQPVRWWRRADCNGETAGAMALAGVALDVARYRTTAGNVGDWLLRSSRMTGGERGDRASAAWGLIGWNDVPAYCGPGTGDGADVYYGDDEARTILGMALAGAALRTDRYDERLLAALLANLRLAGPDGFLPDRIDGPALAAAGLDGMAGAGEVSLSPHYQAHMWACYLWAHRHTGFAPFLERARAAIATTMEAYPDRWVYTTGLQQERAKMLLALAWLVRADDTPRHRAWLGRIAADLLSTQDASGAIRDLIAPPGGPGYHPPASNEAYGTAEAPLIQSNDDAAADLLYTCNFALVALHEAAAATGDEALRRAEDALVAFLCRAQIRSERRPELDGGWFRAFDLSRWECWSSSTDSGWGAWCVETGWSQSWITAVLALRALDTSLWELTAGSGIGRHLPALRDSTPFPGVPAPLP